jgi:hypothetical protein
MTKRSAFGATCHMWALRAGALSVKPRRRWNQRGSAMTQIAKFAPRPL